MTTNTKNNKNQAQTNTAVIRKVTCTVCDKPVPGGRRHVSLVYGVVGSCITLSHWFVPTSTWAPAAPKLLPMIVMRLPPLFFECTNEMKLQAKGLTKRGHEVVVSS